MDSAALQAAYEKAKRERAALLQRPVDDLEKLIDLTVQEKLLRALWFIKMNDLH